MMQRLRQTIERRWYGKAGWLLLFWPLMSLFRALTFIRRRLQTRSQRRLPVPVVIIGNIAVGGTGKTPLLIALARHLQAAGFKPGVISRGYGAQQTQAVRLVEPHSTSEEVGDEPLLIARASQCPVAVGRDRTAAAAFLFEARECDVILSDDGLQHYRLARDLEIVVVDASRGFGNGYCLPCGPLREPVARLHQVDWVVRNGSQPCAQLTPWAPVPMHLKPLAWVNVKTGESRLLNETDWIKEPAYAVAGIGNPQRFFNTLNDLGLTFFPRPFPDHYSYNLDDFNGYSGETVIMTAKDAVKCQAFAPANWWYLEVIAELPESFRNAFLDRVQALTSDH